MNKILSIILVIMVFFAVSEAGLREENKFLEAELKLAKKSNIYFIFNLEEGKILIKVKGMTLKEMPAEVGRLWGKNIPIEPLKLIKKSALLKPKRKEIKPKEKEDEQTSDNFEIEALELKDMPSSYRLVLDKGVRILIRPKAEGILGTLLEALRTVLWYITKPFESAWNAALGRPFAAIELKTEKPYARHIYWSFPEGNEAIVYTGSPTQ